MPLGPNRQKILDQVNSITACCSTRLYDTIDQQAKALAALSNDGHINVVFVLTDGIDDASITSRPQLPPPTATPAPNAAECTQAFPHSYPLAPPRPPLTCPATH